MLSKFDCKSAQQWLIFPTKASYAGSLVILKSSLGSRGGLEKVTLRLARELAKRGHQVTILTSSNAKKPLPEVEGLKMIALTEEGPLSFINLIRFDQKVKKWLKKNPQEIVLGLDRNSLQTHLRAGNGCHAAYLKLRRENPVRFLINPLHHILLRLEKKGFESPSLKRLFVNSRLVKKQILDRYKTLPEKIAVHHNGVEWHEMEKPFEEWPEMRKKLLASWGIPEDHFVLLFAGHGYKRKGLPLLLKALKGFQKVSLLVVGKDKGPFEKHSHVHYFGAVPSLLPFLEASDALVIPSLYDPFANVTVEALAMGLFVCSSKTNGGSEILTSETGTEIEDLFDEQSFKEALNRTLSHPKTTDSAKLIRESVKHLDYTNTLNRFIEELY